MSSSITAQITGTPEVIEKLLRREGFQQLDVKFFLGDEELMQLFPDANGYPTLLETKRQHARTAQAVRTGNLH